MCKLTGQKCSKPKDKSRVTLKPNLRVFLSGSSDQTGITYRPDWCEYADKVRRAFWSPFRCTFCLAAKIGS